MCFFRGRVSFCFGDLRSVRACWSLKWQPIGFLYIIAPESGLERMQTYIEERDKMCNSGWVRMEVLAMEVAANNSHLLYKKWSLRSFLDSTTAIPRSGTYYII